MTTEDYLKERMLRIRKVMVLREMAEAFDCSIQTIQNWIDHPKHIPAGKIDKIKALHYKLRGKINRRAKC